MNAVFDLFSFYKFGQIRRNDLCFLFALIFLCIENYKRVGTSKNATYKGNLKTCKNQGLF